VCSKNGGDGIETADLWHAAPASWCRVALPVLYRLSYPPDNSQPHVGPPTARPGNSLFVTVLRADKKGVFFQARQAIFHSIGITGRVRKILSLDRYSAEAHPLEKTVSD